MFLGSQQRDRCGPSQSYGHSNHETANHSEGVEEFLGEGLIHLEIHPLASITSAFARLLKKGQSFACGETQQTAFKRL